MGGSPGRPEATGRGCISVNRAALRQVKRPIEGTRVGGQRCGNVGSISAQLMAQQGMKIIAVSDKDGGSYNKNGLDILDVMRHVKEQKFLRTYKHGDHISNADLLALDTDVLVPAALENVITDENAAKIRAKIICEGANGPTSSDADAILQDAGILVIPDILANAGGVTVSYFEWVQDRGGFFWDEETVNSRLEKIMVSSYQECAAMAGRKSLSMRIAAYMVAIDRVAAVHRLRGMYA